MNNSTCLFRSLLLHVFLLIALVQAHASKTTWVGSLGATDWNTAANWDNGIPTAIDSAVITGGNLITNLNVLISSDAEALHVSVDDHCILAILQTVTLTIADAPGIGINIENYGVLQNFGILNISNTSIGINARGNFENHGDCTIDGSSQSGIGSLGSALVKNQGNITILNSGAGLNGIGDGLFINESSKTLSIQNCSTGILNSQNASVQNHGSIKITNMEYLGIQNSGSFINNGPLVLKNIGYDTSNINSSIRYGIINASGSFFGTPQIGHFENNSNIVMSELKGSAIFNGFLTTFLNTGITYVLDALENGLVSQTKSTFTISEDGSLILSSISIAPLYIHAGGIFDVADGGFVNITD